MAVPAHDERDFEFAKKYDLEIQPVVFAAGEDGSMPLKKAFIKYGRLINS